MEVLLRNDALTNVADCKGCYPLHLAAWKGDADIVRLLIHQGPSHTKVNEQVCLFSRVPRNRFPRMETRCSRRLLALPKLVAMVVNSYLLMGQEGQCLK